MSTQSHLINSRSGLSTLLAAAIVLAAMLFVAPRAEAVTYNYCTNVTLNYGTTFCSGPRHSIKTNSATAVSPLGSYVCENAALTSAYNTSFVNSWKCANGYVSRSYAGTHLYYPAIAFGKFVNSGGTSPSNAKLSGKATY